ncbi:MAG: hypothetical protein A3F72_01710 [Bacteroidetes bacterium RIFCSPLOWO2_12_FULL_35_15]|nr:MAG: hypothetical protein A3F72_01710 [Bacteroidetes bacterium RIFCSPLOWO2_12_FULL_35_15]
MAWSPDIEHPCITMINCLLSLTSVAFLSCLSLSLFLISFWISPVQRSNYAMGFCAYWDFRREAIVGKALILYGLKNKKGQRELLSFSDGI